MTIATFHFAAQASRLKYAIAPSASVTATGDSTIGIDGSTWTVVGAAGSVVGDWVLSSATKDSVVVTAPAGTNKACLLQRLVSATVNGRTSQIATTAKIYSGIETICPGESYESDQSAGWAPLLNSGLIGGEGREFSPVLSFNSGSYQQTFAGNGSVPCGLAVSSGDRVSGVQVKTLIPANTASELIAAEDLNISGDAFDASANCVVVSESTDSEIMSILRALPDRDTAAPTIVSVTANTADANALNVEFDKPVYCASLTGLSLSFGVGTARTITALESGNFTDTLVFTLSGDLAGSDAFNFVVSATNGIQAMNGGALAADSEAASLTQEFSATNNVVRWRMTDVTTVSGDVDTILDLSGNNNTLTAPAAANRPTYVATDAAINNQPCADLVTNDYLRNLALQVSGGAVPDYAAYTLIAIAKVDTPAGTNCFAQFVPSAGGAFSGMVALCDANSLYWGSITAFSGGYTSTAWAVIKFVHTAARQAIYVDGVLLSERIVADNVPVIVEGRLGGFGGGPSYPFDGRIAEIGLWGKEFDATDDANLATYASLRYGL